jgi:hypothetical protein
MNHRSSSQGFTRKELLVAVAIILLSGCCVVAVFLHTLRRDARRGRVNTTSKTGRDIYTVLSAWAADHNGEFPTARQYSNEAFRELFKAKLVDSENLFWISGDAWHKNSPSGDWKMPPDNEIGTAPDFAEALMAGECAWAYVTGLNQQSDPQLPLLANAFSESVGVYTKDKSRKGGVFLGEKCAWVTVSGSAKASELSPDFRLREIKDGQKSDVFSKAWGTNPDNLKNPEG